QALLEAYQTSKQELEEKLQKLIAFHTSSPSIFSEIARLKQAINQGLAQTKTAWNPTSGTFVVPSQEKLAWANTIRAFQKKKEAQEEPDTTGRTYTRIDLGNGTYVWAWSKDGRTLTQDDIQFTVKHDTWAGKDGGLGKMLAQAETMKAEAKDFDPVKAIKEIADLLTPLGDGIRVVTGQDPITGEKLSGGERGLSLIYIIPLAKVGKYGVKGFKFVAEGMEDINKLNKKADKVKDVEKSTKKASGSEVPKLSTLTEAERLRLANQYKKKSPINIPEDANIKAQSKNGYEQISYKWKENGETIEVRWHTRTPGAPEGQGNTFVVEKTIPGTADGQRRSQQILVGKDKWVSKNDWQKAITDRKNGVSTPEQDKMLTEGHWKE
ncbi:pre-toxin TG domain-containing protein, partial [Listeria seeligeri]